MKHGPVPGGAYDIVKVARGDGGYWPDLPIQACFRVEGHSIYPQRQPNLDLFSDSDVECLEAAIEVYGNMPFDRLRELSQDAAYNAAGPDDFIPFETLVRSLPDGELLLDYLTQ
jgi:hypothetical protein